MSCEVVLALTSARASSLAEPEVASARAAPELEAAQLEVPPEPVELHRELRTGLLAGQPFRPTAGAAVSELLWHRWGPGLQAAGMDRLAFGAVVDGHRRELWLWVVGDRRWEPVVVGLAGRVLRRLPEKS